MKRIGKREVDEFRARLHGMRSALLAKLRHLDADLRILEEETGSELEDRAQDAILAAYLHRFDERERAELAEVYAALRRISRGTYGICQRCGRSIPLARLRAVPSTSECIDCHREAEERERR